MIKNGIYPTMITPYKSGEIDYEAVDKLVDWYAENGITGIFAVCQSSEMNYLSLDERVALAKAVVKRSAGRMNVVASGHCGVSLQSQLEEVERISETGIDQFVLITNKFDIHNDGDDVWLKNAEKFLSNTDERLTFGLYECPTPYKRLLSNRILEWCKSTGRFSFIKDTCCDPDMIAERGALLSGSGIKLYNANAQTLLYSLENGYSGYSGIIANFIPDILVWLFDNYQSNPQKAKMLSNVLSMIAFTESPAYPCTAKYFLNKNVMPMEYFSRSSDEKRLTSYQKLVMDQFWDLAKDIRSKI